jgi:CxxC-x17-CxxC domain-containing protein
VSFTDETLVCRDCGKQFVFTAGEQEFYASRGLLNKPSRCPECRAARKLSRGDSGGVMRGGGYGDRSYDGGMSGGRSSGGTRQMFSATCSNCGKEALVPFQPTSDKPVYCSDCFSQMRSGRY